MYRQHFGLREPPFSLTPDTAFFYAHPGAQAALNTLLVALRSGEGFVKIVAEVGCGKTLLCRRLLAALGRDSATAYIANPALDPRGMLLAVCEELGIPVPAGSTHQVVGAMRRCLLEHAVAGRKVVLIVDEAQCIPDETVEALRLMSNLETEKRKLLQIVLVGQPELDARLARPHLRQLLQRITFADRIAPLQPADVAAYVDWRLHVAGARGEPLFAPAALRELARRSRGIPRLVNVIAHKAMMLAFGEAAGRVLRRHVSLAADDTAAIMAQRRSASWLGRLLSLGERAAGSP